MIPIRAFVTEIGADTLAQTTAPGSGAPRWPFDPTLSVPYVLDQALETQFLAALYGTEEGVAGTRALLERGAGAVATFLSSIWPLAAPEPLPGPARCDASQPASGFFRCGAETECVDGCCVAEGDTCASPCPVGNECEVGAMCVNGCCQGGLR